tara:strand:- start:553 stop:789 length:237 start_codon:yes stop_codon:yes gene_type:complete
MSQNTMEIELYNGSGWLKVELPEGGTIQTLLDRFGEDKEGGFIPQSARFMAGETVVDRTHQLSSEDKVSFTSSNKMGG